MLRMILVYLLPLFVFVYGAPVTENINNRPIIAVLAQDAKPYYNRSYIAASYVKYLESSGARVVPVPSHMSDEQVEEIFNGVNGVLFPGGGTKWDDTSGYFKHAKYFMKRAMETNKNGDYFPVWGTCLGFQTLQVIIAGTSDILSRDDAEDITLPLNYTEAARNSRLFTEMPMDMFKILGSENISYHHHNFGINPQIYEEQLKLKEFYSPLSMNRGKEGDLFISTVEAFDYPIYGTQWHPEKSNFEFTSVEHVPHSEHAIRVTQYMSNFFVNEARKSQHKFDSVEKEREYLIYNYTPEYTGKGNVYPNFEQCYFFNNSK